MQLADAYRVLGAQPGATEADVRHAHDQLQLEWHGDRHNQNPQASQLAYARRAELAVALDLIHRAGFPDAQGQARMAAYGAQAPAPYQPPPAPPAAYQPLPPNPYAAPVPAANPWPQQSADIAKAQKRKQAVWQIVLGLGLCLVGIIITSATHEHAVQNGGGTYVVAYGPIIFGAISFFKGLFGLMAS